MRKTLLTVIVAAVAITTTVTACSSSKSKGTGASGGTAASGTTIKLGVISDLTGSASSGFITAEKGIKAYVEGVNAAGGINGQKLSYVMADSTSTIPGALTAAQKLVQSDKVFAVIDVSSDFSGAEPYLLKQGIPAIGGAFDGPEWNDKANDNMFASTGTTSYTTVNSAAGEYLKARGVTSCGTIGYASSISAQKSASGIIKSCTAAGLKNGYLNNQIPFGSTDLGAVALAIKKAGVDGMYVPVVPATGFALAAALKQIGVTLKAFLLPVGYGSDLLQSDAAVAAAQGYEFASVGQPVEANTPATQKLVANLALAGVTGSPTFAEQEAYVAMAAFADGLRKAGANPSQKAFMTAMRGINDFDADGLLAPSKVDFSNFSQFGQGAGTGGCIFAAQLEGKKFTVVPNTPICGKTLEGVTVG
jgi:branched-chain amino acid transport system substrate-binding protein